MKIDVLCWNVRNLSNTIARPGVRGRGLLLDFRIQTVAFNIKRMSPHLAFILETGPDGATVADELNALLPHHTVEASNTTEGESYLIVKANKFIRHVQGHALIPTVEGYRAGLLVSLRIATERHPRSVRVNIGVLHAPSPGHNIDDRMACIEAVARGIKQPGVTSFLMGDLNIKRN